MRTPDFFFSLASPLALLGWALLVLAPRGRFTRLLVLSGFLPLVLAAAYTGLIAVHYLGQHRGEGGFSSLAQVAALFRDPWALLAGWVHICASTWPWAPGKPAMPTGAGCRTWPWYPACSPRF